MLSRLIRILYTILIVIIVIAIVLGATGAYLVRRSFPTLTGEITLTGLDAPVDIYRDSLGIPQIYAQTSHDLFFAQGYAHAQDRFWQMDFWRHLGTASLSEMFGKGQLEKDIYLRTLGWARVAQQEWEAFDPDEQVVLQDYADGVNAYLADHKGAALSLEYALLKLLTPGYTPEPWQPINSITMGKVMAWQLGGSGGITAEGEHATLSKSFTPEQIAELFPPYPSDNPVIIPSYSTGSAGDNQTGLSSKTQYLANMSPAFQDILAKTSSLETIMGAIGNGIGSNNWVIDGSRTATGKPFLANDMHLGEQLPAIWYENGLHCTPKGSSCPYEVSGFSFASVPGIIVGHNDRIAWGFTNVNPDVLDLYIEKINPDNPSQYEVNGKWEDMTLVQEKVKVAGASPVDLTVRYTRHGPIIWDNPDDHQTVQEKWGVNLPANFAISVRWTALEPVNIIKAILGYDSAQNWDEFRQAARDFAVPSQNTVYADIDGNIGYQTPGNIPIRRPGHTGEYPVPGWTDEYEWQGYIAFDQLPKAYNPPEGYIVTANNAVVGANYPFTLSTSWDYGFRAARIVQLIKEASTPIDAGYIQKIHGDNYNASAAYMVPLLMQLPIQDQHLVTIRDLLKDWDYQNKMGMAAPAIYNAFWRAILARTFRDQLPKDYWPDGDSLWFEIMRRLIQTPDSAWWDDIATPEVEKRDDILGLAFADGVVELEHLLGKNPSRWTWGDIHTVTFHNQTLGQSGIAPIEALFNRGPYQTAGGNAIINATGWDTSVIESSKAYKVESLPSERLIVDLSNLSASQSVITTGESGHAFSPHYVDQANLWRMIQYHPMLWEKDQVESASKDHLVLKP